MRFVGPATAVRRRGRYLRPRTRCSVQAERCPSYTSSTISVASTPSDRRARIEQPVRAGSAGTARHAADARHGSVGDPRARRTALRAPSPWTGVEHAASRDGCRCAVACWDRWRGGRSDPAAGVRDPSSGPARQDLLASSGCAPVGTSAPSGSGHRLSRSPQALPRQHLGARRPGDFLCSAGPRTRPRRSRSLLPPLTAVLSLLRHAGARLWTPHTWIRLRAPYLERLSVEIETERRARCLPHRVFVEDGDGSTPMRRATSISIAQAIQVGWPWTHSPEPAGRCVNGGEGDRGRRRFRLLHVARVVSSAAICAPIASRPHSISSSGSKNPSHRTSRPNRGRTTTSAYRASCAARWRRSSARDVSRKPGACTSEGSDRSLPVQVHGDHHVGSHVPYRLRGNRHREPAVGEEPPVDLHGPEHPGD